MTQPMTAAQPVVPRRRSVFMGAVLPVCGVEVLIVAVKPFIIADEHEANLYMIAFQMRFGRTVVLMSQDDARVPTYYGPPPIVQALSLLPFELIPWRSMPFRIPKPPPWQLPIPPESPDEASANCNASSSDDLAKTRIVDRGERTTRR